MWAYHEGGGSSRGAHPNEFFNFIERKDEEQQKRKIGFQAERKHEKVRENLEREKEWRYFFLSLSYYLL